MKPRRNGARDLSIKEFGHIKRMVWVGYRDEEIGDLVGRTTKSVRGIREYYGLAREIKPRKPNASFSDEESAVINERLRGWVQLEKLSSREMANRLKVLHPPGLHFGSVLRRIKQLDPNKAVWKEHQRNERDRRSRRMSRRHIKGGAKTQPRGYHGYFASRQGEETCADQQTQAGRI